MDEGRGPSPLPFLNQYITSALFHAMTWLNILDTIVSIALLVVSIALLVELRKHRKE